MSRKYSHNSLFRPGDIELSYLNACVGPNGGPYKLEDYAEGYFEAGRRLLGSFVKEMNGEAVVVNYKIDLLIYPLVFLFRHGIELSIKSLCRKFAELWNENEKIALTHNLSDNWVRAQEYMNRDSSYNRELIDEVDTILKDFLAIDPDGQRFRFPEARDGQSHLQDISLVNLVVFDEAMAKVVSAFDFWLDRLEDQEIAKAEREGA
jgi:hypothetical protein